MLLSVSPDDFRRLEPYLPRGLVESDDDDPTSRAAGQLARMILMQRLHPGQKVPMDEIAERIGSSRTPVREALRRLETEGLVGSLPNRGFVVRRIGPDDAAHLYDARRCVERYTAQSAFARRNRSFLAELRALHRMYERVLGGTQDRRRLGMLVDKAFHVRIAEQAGNPHLASMLANTFDRLILTRSMDGFPVSRMPSAVAEHQAIVAAFEADSARVAIEALTVNIDNGGAAIVGHLRSLEGFGAPAEPA
jgi:DNA-binding GntR family transcriptional regulator